MKNAFLNFKIPLMVIEENVVNTIWSYIPKDFAEKGIFGISQGTRVLGPPIGWGCLMA